MGHAMIQVLYCISRYPRRVARKLGWRNLDRKIARHDAYMAARFEAFPNW